MGVVVAFSYPAWAALYPEFNTTVSPSQAQEYFTLATSIHRNDGGWPVNDPTQQLSLLNMLTAHIAALLAPSNPGGTPSAIVGRINSATEGSVNVQAQYSTNVSQQMAYFVQTKYGAMYWVASAPYRTMRYRPSLRRGVVQIGPPGFGV
jgi:hypothetical protein